MAAPGIRKHLDIFYDHLSESSLLETTQSLVRFFKNNIFSYSVKAMPGKMRKKEKNSKDCPSDAKISRHVTSNYMGKRWENETAIS